MAQTGGADSPTDAVAPEQQAGTEPGVGRVGTHWASVLKDTPPWLDRVGSLAAAGLILFTAKRWWDRAFELNDPCSRAREVELSKTVCDEVPEFFQNVQFVLAIVGIAVAGLLAALMLFQAVSGLRVPWLRLVAAILAVLGVTWVVVFVVGLLFL